METPVTNKEKTSPLLYLAKGAGNLVLDAFALCADVLLTPVTTTMGWYKMLRKDGVNPLVSAAISLAFPRICSLPGLTFFLCGKEAGFIGMAAMDIALNLFQGAMDFPKRVFFFTSKRNKTRRLES